MSIALVAQGIGAISKIAGGIAAKKRAREAQRKADAKERSANMEMARMKNMYSQLDTSNPYLNMENKMEDLTVNQQQAQFQSQQFAQSQANIMDSMRGSAGGSGIAALAQQLSQSGQMAAQSAAASIGQQEQANQKLAAQEESRLQGMERRGVVESRAAQQAKVDKLMGLAQDDQSRARGLVDAANQQSEQAAAGMYDAIGGAASDVAGMFGG
jgi:hypothetical protein